MRIGIAIYVLAFTHIATAQLMLKPLKETAQESSRRTALSASSNSLSLPFWDDFATSLDSPDTTHWRYGNTVSVSNGRAKNAPTFNVASFDGQNGSGIAYNLSGEYNTLTDSLVSQNIDLSTYSLSDNPFLSFYWQAGGYGEFPEDEDSLRLQFYASDSTYRQVWSTGAVEDSLTSEFFQVLIPLNDTSYFHSDFRFKFQSYSSPAGPFDVWNIDYVYLNSGRSFADTTYMDRAISGHFGGLFGRYTTIPAEFFFDTPEAFLDSQSISINNLSKVSSSIVVNYKLENLTTTETYFDQQIPTSPTTLAPQQSISISSPSSLTIPPQTTPLDSQVIQSTFYLTTADTLATKQNDTVSQKILLHNYYAYDDGTAEFAAGLNVNQAKLAQRFILAEGDTLTEIDIHFPSIDPTSEGKSINMMVWSSLDPELVIASQPHTIEAASSRNQFERIQLSSSRLVGDTIYVGFQQLVGDFLAVGFDKNNAAAMDNIFYKTGADWQQNDRLEGILMIRPVFNSDSAFILSNRPEFSSVSVYPNPTMGSFQVNEDHEYLEVFDLSGNKIYSSPSKATYSINDQPGLYIVRVYRKGKVFTSKLILE